VSSGWTSSRTIRAGGKRANHRDMPLIEADRARHPHRFRDLPALGPRGMQAAGALLVLRTGVITMVSADWEVVRVSGIVGEYRGLPVPDTFSPHLDILPPPQRRLWDALAELPAEFVLYGGTAVALHLGHRHSVDFDFFGSRPLDPTNLALAIPFLAGATITQREATRWATSSIGVGR
jgi:nucleotidyltransferase AbiEii toxin of type IV toxin-antitoxin system